MQLSTNGISIYLKRNFRKKDSTKSTILFLHGFGGCASDWKETFSFLGSEFQLIAIDLPGFGKSAKPTNEKFYRRNFLFQLLVDTLRQLNLSEVILAGYSMGGRLSLQFAERFPKKVKALILESATAGIKTKKERFARQQTDAALIDFIKKNSLADFFTLWQNQSLFASQKNLPLKKQFSILKKKISANSQIGLINSLKYFGQGEGENLWQKLTTITVPTLMLSGELDTKYCGILREAHNFLPNSTHIIVEGAGHNIHLEKPELFVNFVKEFLHSLH